jgi:hypothetical protein
VSALEHSTASDLTPFWRMFARFIGSIRSLKRGFAIGVGYGQATAGTLHGGKNWYYAHSSLKVVAMKTILLSSAAIVAADCDYSREGHGACGFAFRR